MTIINAIGINRFGNTPDWLLVNRQWVGAESHRPTRSESTYHQHSAGLEICSILYRAIGEFIEEHLIMEISLRASMSI